ncbi:ABC transporter permease [Avibacterium sp. 20-126]|uniref:ABC transporter permease n=1 Tax=Avibacterium sp. 20-126 TaxID=2911524 RepID=UPI0021877C5A|nr:ABC transporter permease [Avibacterium sp. 20-126]
MRAFFSHVWAVLVKEFLQMRRDRTTFAMMLAIPLLELFLFGYAINMRPQHLPFAVQSSDSTEITRSIRSAMVQSGYFLDKGDSRAEEGERLLQSGKVNFILVIPPDFSKQLVRGEKPQILLKADASDPSASGASAYFAEIVQQALHPYQRDYRLALPERPVQTVVHHLYNPKSITQYNIVPGLLGIILQMTGVMMTAITMSRERERGTLENLLAMPVRPLEVMLGKILPYIGVGIVKSLVIIVAGKWLFAVPFLGSAWLLSAGLALFLSASLILGFAISTMAQSQLQALQLTFFFFLPSMMLSGFMFPFRGMPMWAQYIGEVLPVTHILRIVRGIMLKDADMSALAGDFAALSVFTLLMGWVAVKRYKTTMG